MKECKHCGYDEVEDDCKVCPKCNKSGFIHSVSCLDGINLSDEITKVAIKGPKIGRRRAHEYVTKVEDSHKHNCRVIVNREINRVEDTYLEEVKKKDTGEIVHRCEEPLSKHQGRGSAKKKK